MITDFFFMHMLFCFRGLEHNILALCCTQKLLFVNCQSYYPLALLCFTAVVSNFFLLVTHFYCIFLSDPFFVYDHTTHNMIKRMKNNIMRTEIMYLETIYYYYET